jgi:hypothetical protein
VRFALVVLARLPFVLRPLLALELRLLLPLLLRPLLAFELRLLPFVLRPLLALEARLLLPFVLRPLLAPAARLVVVALRARLCAPVLRRVSPPDALEARLPVARVVWPPPVLAPFALDAVGFDLRVLGVGRADPLLLPSFDVKASTASRGACTVLRAPLATFAAGWLKIPVRLRLEITFPSLLAAICATVATPAPAAKPLAADTRAFENCSDAWVRVAPARLIASPTAVAAIARAVSLSSTSRARR